MKLLHIDSSILGDASASRTLSARAVAQWQARHPETEITYRDLAAQPLAHLTAPMLAALRTDPADLSPEQLDEVAPLYEFLAADVVVIGVPMYNFGIPSQIKAWIDRLAVAGKTFAYTADGPQGLASGKIIIVASARGGIYSAGTPMAAIDHQETYLSAIFGFFGITDIRFLRAEGLQISPETRGAALSRAEQEVELLAA